jgi:hypothetical protein
MSEEVPIACRLADDDLRRREATLLAQFKSAVIATEELENGYAFRLPGDRASLALAAELVSAERECCPFLTFELRAEAKMGPLVLRVSGPAPSKEFLKSILL